MTWQDPVALILAALGIALAFYLRRRGGGKGHCSHCPMKDKPH